MSIGFIVQETKRPKTVTSAKDVIVFTLYLH
jgi:hypothetical protein